MITFFALLAASMAIASEPPALKLDAVATIPAGSLKVSRDFSFGAQVKGQSVGVWRLSDGRQAHKVSLPAVKSDDQYQLSFYVTDFSPDNKSLILALQNKRDWKQGEVALYLVTLDDEKVKPLFTARKWCRNGLYDEKGLVPHFCPTVTAAFLPDGKRLAVSVIGFSEKHYHAATSPFVRDYQALIVDLDGKVLEEQKSQVRTNPSVEDKAQPDVELDNEGAATAGLDARGRRLGVAKDESGCELRDLSAGKRLEFLSDCTVVTPVAFHGDGRLVSYSPGTSGSDYAAEKGIAKAWDAASGRLIFKRPVSGCGAFGWAAAANVAYQVKSDEKRLEAWDSEFKHPLGAASGIESSGCSSLEVSPDGSRVLISKEGDTSVIYATGLNVGAPLAAGPAVAETPSVNVDEPPVSKTKLDPDAYAVVIGIEKYRQDGIPAVDYASRDAKTVYSYLTRSMGFDAKNVVLLTDEHATRTDFEKNLGKWLQNRVSEKSHVFVYYAGHGAPNPVSGEGYLMPYEADPNYVEETAYPVAKLYAALGKLPTKDVTVVLDACFSGQGGRSLIAKGARPLVNVKTAKAEGNTVVLAAASASQISAADPERRHGLLTESLLEALHGAADAGGDGQITAEEIYAYVRPAVERAARLQNIEQTPTMAPAPAKGGRPWITLK